jgi:hypothetical protein
MDAWLTLDAILAHLLPTFELPPRGKAKNQIVIGEIETVKKSDHLANMSLTKKIGKA